MTEIQLLMAWWSTTTTRVLRQARDGDRGEVEVGWVIVAGITAVLAIAIGAIIVAKVTDKANSIDLQ